MPFQSYKMFSILNPLDKCGKYEAYKMQFHHQNPSSDCPKEAPTKCISFIIRALWTYYLLQKAGYSLSFFYKMDTTEPSVVGTGPAFL